MSESPSNHQRSCTNNVVGTESKPFYQETKTLATVLLVALDKELELQPTDNEPVTATTKTLSEATATTSSFSVLKKSEPVVTSAAAAEESFHLKWNAALSSSSPTRTSSLPDNNENHVSQEGNFVRDFLMEFEDADCRNGGDGTLDVDSYTTLLEQQQQQWSTATDAATNTSWKENLAVQLRYLNPDSMDLSYGLSRPSSPSSFIPMSIQPTEIIEPFSLSSAAYNGNNYHSLRQPTMQHYQGHPPQGSACFHRCYCHYDSSPVYHHPHCYHDSPSTPSLISSSNGIDNGFFQPPSIPPQNMHPQHHHTCSSAANQVLFGMGENDLTDDSDMATITSPATATTTTTATTTSNGSDTKALLPNEHSYPFSPLPSSFDNISIAQHDSKRTAASSLTAKKNGKQVITNYQRRQCKQASMPALKAKAALSKTTIQKLSLSTSSSPRESPTAALLTSPYPDVIDEAPKTMLRGQSIPGQQSSRRTRTSYDPKTSYHLNVLFFETFGSCGRKPTKKERRKVEKHTGISSRRLTYWLSNHKRRYALELQAFSRLIGQGLIHGYDSFVDYCRHNDVPELRRNIDVDEQQPGSSADHANHQQQQSTTEEDEDYDVDDDGTEYNDGSNSSNGTSMNTTNASSSSGSSTTE